MAEPALDLSEIIDLYKEDARLMISKMGAALDRWVEVQEGGEPRHQLRRLSHQLRGSGRTYGFRNVTRFSKAIETIMLKLEKKTLPADERTRLAIRRKIDLLSAVFA